MSRQFPQREINPILHDPVIPVTGDRAKPVTPLTSPTAPEILPRPVDSIDIEREYDDVDEFFVKDWKFGKGISLVNKFKYGLGDIKLTVVSLEISLGPPSQRRTVVC